MKVLIDGKCSLESAGQISRKIEELIKNKVDSIAEVQVMVEPA